MPRWQRAIGIAVVAVLAALAIAVPVYLFAPAVGDVSGEALQSSLIDEIEVYANGTDPRPCFRRGELWECETEDGDSGVAGWYVARDGRCWRAMPIGDPRRSGVPAWAEGCVRLRDQLRLGDRLLYGLD
jgi:hypothetical protein